MLKVANVKPTDQVIVVSGAAGATGSTVVQIAKNILGIKTVIGIAGSPEKCKMLISECGCNLALNYKSPNFEQELMDATPDFIDIFFDNVGGWIMDACMKRMNVYGRVVCCGALSAYDKDETKEMVMSAESYFLIVSRSYYTRISLEAIKHRESGG
jgi:NADPH-dependent curcumin reductase CurA